MSRDALHPAMILEAAAVMDAQDTRITQYDGPGCYYCDSLDGMDAWYPEHIIAARAEATGPPPQLYRLRSRPLEEHEYLFTPCCVCNRTGIVDRERYEVVSMEEVQEWLEGGL